MNEQAPPVDGSLRTRVRDHLGVDPGSLPVIGEEVAIYNRVNLQLALDAWAQGEDRAIEPIGFGASNRWMGVELGDLLGRTNPTGRGIDIAPANYTEAELPDGARLRCVEGAVLLITDGAQRFVGLIARAQQRSAGPPPFILQIAAVDQDAVSGLLSELRRLRHELNVYRGRVVAVMRGDRHNLFDGQLNLAYVESTVRERDDVILAAGVLERIERHTIEFSRHIDRLRALGRGVRRGLLLYGPPGTGKTHTVSYLASALEGRTTFIITGASFGMLPPICRLARELAPSMVVLEGVDLVALERSMPGQGANPLLFELMNEMDGVGSDADIIFFVDHEPCRSTRAGACGAPGPSRSRDRDRTTGSALSTPTDRVVRPRAVAVYGGEGLVGGSHRGRERRVHQGVVTPLRVARRDPRRCRDDGGQRCMRRRRARRTTAGERRTHTSPARRAPRRR